MDSFTIQAFKADPQRQIEAARLEMEDALNSFRYFVTVTMQFDGTRGLTPAQVAAGMVSEDPDFTDSAYDPVFEAFEAFRFEDGLLMLPRGTGKSTLIALYAMWLGLKDPNERIGIICSKFDQAAEILFMVREWMVSAKEKRLRQAFGPFGYLPPVGQKWGTERELIFPRRTLVARNGTISCFGANERVEGGHLSRIFMDDLSNQETAKTKEGREQVIRFVQATTGLGRTLVDREGKVAADTRKILIGTPWADDDVLMVAMRAEAERRKQGQPKMLHVLRLPARVPRVVFKEELGGQLIRTEEYDQECEARFRHLPDEILRRKRENGPPIGYGPALYAAQMDLDPVPAEEMLFQAEWFTEHYYERESVFGKDGKLRPDLLCCGFVDLAGSFGTTGDRSAHGAVAVDSRGHIYLIEALAGRFKPQANLQIMADWTKRYNYLYIGVEGGVLRHVYQGEQVDWNRKNPDKAISLRKVESAGSRGSANDRALRIQAKAMRGEIHLLPEHTDVLEELLRYRFKDDSRDDYVAMLALACLNLVWGDAPVEEEAPKTQVQRIYDAVVSQNTGPENGTEGPYDSWIG